MKPVRWFVKPLWKKNRPIMWTILATSLEIAHDLARAKFGLHADIVTYNNQVPVVDKSEEGRAWWREHGY